MAKIKVNPRFAQEALASPVVRKATESKTNEVGRMAKQNASAFSSTIAKGIRTEVVFERGVWVGKVIATDFKSHWFEFGTVKMRARPYLSPAAMTAGLSLKPRRRV